MIRPEMGPALSEFLDGVLALDDGDDAVAVLCDLNALVAHSGVTGFPAHPADCFCLPSDLRHGRFEHDGATLRYIITATLRQLADDGKAVAA